MKQVTHTQRRGGVQLQDVPAPVLRPGGLLVRTAYSVISAGTERAKVEVAQKGLLAKALARPDQVRQVLESARQIGLAATYQKVTSRLEAMSPLGYSSAGIVLAVGDDVRGFSPGDRVACGGASAAHAAIVYVPRNLCVHVAQAVGLDEAAFATVGAIALQGVRQAGPALGETVGVIGLGLLGLLTVQLLRSAGCRVVGVDPDDHRRALATRFGADPVFAPGSPDGERLTRQVCSGGLDAVIVTAASTSSEPVELAGRLSRDRGRVVIVGAVRIDVPRSPFYEKELEVRLSRSYGPGRYDPQYEEKGTDYPIGYVRWTEGRNMAAFLDLLAQCKLDIAPLITHRFPLEQAPDAYAMLTGGSESSLGVVLEYGVIEAPGGVPVAPETVRVGDQPRPAGKVSLGLVGAGNFAQAMLLPQLRRHPDVFLRAVATAGGLAAASVADRAGFEISAADPAALFGDPGIDLVMIASRHQSHAALAAASLRAGKAVFVEKPLALSADQLAEVVTAYEETSQRARVDQAVRPPFLMVGFNRRFQPMVHSLREFMAQGHEPLLVHYRVNAGYVPREHWTQDADEGGGRIVGEMCHFVDLVLHLVGQPPNHVYAQVLPDLGRYNGDNVSAMIRFVDGSVATLIYAANGDRGLTKERIEIFGGGRAGVLEDFRKMTLAGGGRRHVRRSGPDKGHRAELTALVDAVKRGKSSPVAFEQAVDSMNVTFAIERSLRLGQPVNVHTGPSA